MENIKYQDFGTALYVVLEHANLEIANTKKGVELLNHEDHSKFIQNKLKKSLDDFRPDIVH
jgi:hypothetical protein